MSFNIAIDGPAGAGKSTVAKKVAGKLSFVYVDTGAMYRALAVLFLQEGIKANENDKMIKACENAEVTISYRDGVQHVFLNGADITDQLRTEEVGNMASAGSALPEIRAKLLALQKNLAKSYDVVMDGRDIGTNILPGADVKIFLTASAETRANRRFLELRDKGMERDYASILKDIQNRDERDMSRKTAPLKQAEDAERIDSSDMTADEVVDRILEIVVRKRRQA